MFAYTSKKKFHRCSESVACTRLAPHQSPNKPWLIITKSIATKQTTENVKEGCLLCAELLWERSDFVKIILC